MEPALLIFGGLFLILVVMVLALGLWHPSSGTDIVGRSLRDHEAEARIEAMDIDEMIEARDELRRARGKPSIADELADEVRGPADGP